MTSPALGIAYFLWLRLRLLFVAAFVLVPVFAVAIRLFPETAPYCQFACVILFFLALVPLLHTCTFGPADLAARTSGFPAYMFVLPMSNRSLVGWPMLFAAVIFGSMWSVVAILVFIPTDIPLPVSWPAAMLVAMCVWIQAVGWSPFPSPFIRVPMLVITVAPLILFPVAIGILPPSLRMTPLLVAWSVAWSLVAYLFAVRGISRARSGDEGDWFRTVADRVATTYHRRIVLSHTGPRPPFRSAASAQLWHEWRRNAIAMPVMVALIGVPLLAAVCQSLVGGRKHSGIAIGTIEVSPALLSLAICIGLPC